MKPKPGAESPMKCTECGGTMKVRKESYRYDESGLKHVTLVGVNSVMVPRERREVIRADSRYPRVSAKILVITSEAGILYNSIRIEIVSSGGDTRPRSQLETN